MSVYLDEFETALYYALDDNPSLTELRGWFETFAALWQESNAEYFECGEQCEPGACEDCDFNRDDEEPVLSEHEAAVSQAQAMLKALAEDIDPQLVISTPVEDRLTQIESLLNLLFDEVRNLKALSPPDRWPAKTLPSTPSFPQQPYQPPLTIPSFPHSPHHPWANSPSVKYGVCECGGTCGC